jgi:hypothetical protein
MVKKFFLMALIAITPVFLYAQTDDFGVEEEAPDSVVWTQEGFESAHAAMSAMGESFGLRYDIVYRGDGSIEEAMMRGGLYVSPIRLGFEYNYLFSSTTNYPAWTAEIGLGYRTRRVDMRIYAGLGYAEYGKLSDKDAWYLAPRVSAEFLYEVARDKQFEENLFKVGAALNYKHRRTYINDGIVESSFSGSYPGIALVLEYERQFWGKRSSIAVGVQVGTDCEIGNGTKAWGLAGSVNISYRIGVQKKDVWKSNSDLK